jgi:integrase
MIKQFLRWCESRHLVAENLLRTYPCGTPEDPRRRDLRTSPVIRRFGLYRDARRGGSKPAARRRRFAARLVPHQVPSRCRDQAPAIAEGSDPSRVAGAAWRITSTVGTVLLRGGVEREVPGRRPSDQPETLNEAFQSVAKRLGMPIGRESGYTLDALRRFFEAFCINSGVPQRAVDTWMGHRSDKSMAAAYYSRSDADSQTLMAKVPFSFE